MASSTETTVTSLKVHKVPTYDLWKAQYGSGIGVDDLVIIPPSQLQPALPTQSASTNGKFLTNNGSGTLSWATVDALPSQSGHNGQYLTTNGTSASWVAINPLPSQAGNFGKFLTTDGSTASWVTLTIPGGSSTSPKMNGTATVGTETTWAHGDHIHPTDTTLQTKITVNGILQGDGSGNITALTSSAVTLTGIGTANGVATLDSYGKVTANQTAARVIEITSNITLGTEHCGCLLLAEQNCTITIPNGLPAGTEIEVMNYSSTLTTTITPDSNTRINGGTSSITITEAYKSVVLKLIITTSGEIDMWAAQGAIE